MEALIVLYLFSEHFSALSAIKKHGKKVAFGTLVGKHCNIPGVMHHQLLFSWVRTRLGQIIKHINDYDTEPQFLQDIDMKPIYYCKQSTEFTGPV